MEARPRKSYEPKTIALTDKPEWEDALALSISPLDSLLSSQDLGIQLPKSCAENLLFFA